MEKHSVKIQINSLPALERLIGNDTEFEAEFRRAVGSRLIKQFIDPANNVRLFKLLEHDLQTLFVDQIKVKGTTSWNDKIEYKLSEKAKELIYAEVSESLNKIVNDVLNQNVKTIEDQINIKFKNLDDSIDKVINEAAKLIESKLTDLVLTERINQLVDQKIKERLNIK